MCRHGPVTSISRSIASPQHSGRRIHQREAQLFFVVFDKTDRWNADLDNAKLPRAEPGQVDGFLGNIGYRSLTREGWLLSGWRDEKAVVRWPPRSATLFLDGAPPGRYVTATVVRTGE